MIKFKDKNSNSRWIMGGRSKKKTKKPIMDIMVKDVW